MALVFLRTRGIQVVFWPMVHVVQEVGDIVDMVISINFQRLMTIFNVIIICPVRASDLVAGALTTSGAVKTQQGFIVDTNSRYTVTTV